ncbi:PAS domain-containing protein [Alteromonas sp. McT4-15]|uniref:sensor histidine kinase n=1 Tax=Alteromonas sp. McT4-15 TaxID=2881256 RepID=UPI001CF8C6A3|nr:ATP-binding protein [Alteromonas sp. McT4-15]MCB4435617.1 PAS domain-containing protein [Alteromonas sp. McT4-15]
MGFNRFSLLLSIRVCCLMASVALAAFLWFTPGYTATFVLTVIVAVGLGFETRKFVSKTNAELTRFLESVRHGELTQRFAYPEFGSGFEKLGETFTGILSDLQQKRTEQEQTLRHLKALVEQVPVPLLSLYENGEIVLWNHNARKLFGTVLVKDKHDLAQFSPHLATTLVNIRPGEKELVEFEADGSTHKLTVSVSHIIIAGKQEKLISLQDINSELGLAQLQAWQALVRVLTHEIMNSITPVASLADTTSHLVKDIKQNYQHSDMLLADLDDVEHAADTLSRRSNGLMQFVGSYKKLTRLPAPDLQPVKVNELLEQTIAVFAQSWQQKGITIDTQLGSAPIVIDADRSMIEQIIVNIMHNAEHALSQSNNPKVTISVHLTKRSRCVIEIADNGPGVADDIISKVFVPFFTTKREGTGVGLALTQQIMVAHGGQVNIRNLESGGACFSLVF